MADGLGALVISLTAETAQFNDALTKSAYQLGQWGTQVQSSVSNIAGTFSVLKTAVEAVVFSQAIRGAADFVTSIVDAQSHLQDLAISTGTTASQMSALMPAALESGTSLDTVAQGAARLERSLSPLSATAKLGKEAMAALGFSAEDTARFLKDPSEGLLEIAQRLNTFQDNGNKTAVVMALMGRGASEMLPFLKQLGEQSQLTATVTDEQAAAAHRLETEWGATKVQAEALKNELAIAIVPVLYDAVTAFNSARAAGVGFWGSFELAGITSHGLTTWLQQDRDELTKLQTNLENFQKAQQHTQNSTYWDDLQKAIDATTGKIKDTEKELAALQAINAQRILDRPGLSGPASFDARDYQAHPALLPSIDTIAQGADKTATAFATAMQAAQKAITDAQNAMDDFGKTISQQTSPAMKTLIDLIGSNEWAKYSAAQQQRVQDTYLEADAIEHTTASMKQQLADENEYVKQVTAEWADYTKEITSTVDVHDTANVSIGKMLENMKAEADNAGLSASATKDLTFQMTMLHAGITQGSELWNNYLDTFRKWETEAASTKSITEAAKQAQQAWKTTADSIQSSLLQAFDGWASGARNISQQLRDFMLRMFDTLILKPILAPIAGGIAGIVAPGAAGASGLGGAANDVSGLSGLGGLWQSLSAFPTEVAALGANLGMAFGAGGLASIGGIGGLISSALPVVGPILAVAALASNLFGKGGGPKDGGFAQTGTDFGRFFTPNSADSSLQTIASGDLSAYNTTLAALGGTGSANFAFGYDTDPKGTANSRLSAGVTVGGQQVYGFSNRDEGRGTTALQADLKLEAQRAILAALQASDLPKDVANILDSVAPSTASADQVQQVIELATAYSDLGKMLAANPIADAMSAFTKSSEGAYGAFQDLGTAYTTLLSTYDGTTTATQDLDKASQAYYNSLVAVLAQIQQVKQSIDTMFSDTIRGFQLKGMDKQQQYNFYQSEAQTLTGQLSAATDPATVQALETKINADLQAAFGLLDPTQQTALLSRFIAGTSAAQAAGDLRLTQLGANATTTFDQNIATAQAAITKAATDMSAAAAVIAKAASDQTTAANTALRAAQTPITITVDTTTGATEVNSGG